MPIESRRGKRCCEQDDAEIGVLPDGALRRRGRKPDALADADAFAADERSRRFGACGEIGYRHAVAVAEAVHVSGLQRVEFGKAGVEEGFGRSRSA